MADQNPRRQRKATDRFTPTGAQDELPPVPGTVLITESDKDKAVRAWDAADTGLTGLLSATVEE